MDSHCWYDRLYNEMTREWFIEYRVLFEIFSGKHSKIVLYKSLPVKLPKICMGTTIAPKKLQIA